MLFSSALLFFLFATFVAAAPTAKLQKRAPAGLDFEEEKNMEFLTAGGGAWHRVGELDKSGAQQLTFTQTPSSYVVGRKNLMVSSESQGPALRWAKVQPTDKKWELAGTWERKETGSRIEIEVQHPDSFCSFKIIAPGRVEWKGNRT